MLFSKLSRFLTLPRVYGFLHRAVPWLTGAVAVLFIIGLVWSLYLAPQDYKQGETYRIIFIHVPAAWMSLLVYTLMAVFGLVHLVWRFKLASYIHSECAVIGAWFTVITLITGMLWGRPMWGAYWVWDARLTSELILLFLYLGVILLLHTVPEHGRAVRASALLSLLGLVNIPIIHFSVYWWNTLHQPATVTKFGAPSMHSSMLAPLLYMTAVFFLYFVSVLGLRLLVVIAENNCRSRWWLLTRTNHTEADTQSESGRG